MEKQDLPDLLNGQRGTVGAVAGLDNELACGIVQMTAPVGHDSVRSARRKGFFPVAHDAVAGDVSRSFQAGKEFQRRRIRAEIVYARIPFEHDQLLLSAFPQ